MSRLTERAKLLHDLERGHTSFQGFLLGSIITLDAAMGVILLTVAPAWPLNLTALLLIIAGGVMCCLWKLLIDQGPRAIPRGGWHLLAGTGQWLACIIIGLTLLGILSAIYTEVSGLLPRTRGIGLIAVASWVGDVVGYTVLIGTGWALSFLLGRLRA